MTLSSSLSTHSTLTQAFPFSIIQHALQLIFGWLLIFLLLTPVRLNSCSLDSKTNLPKYTTHHVTTFILLEILALSLTNILLSLTKLQLSPKHVTITFVNFAVSGRTFIRQRPAPLLPLSSTPNLITVIISNINSLSLNYPISSRPTSGTDSLAHTVVKAPKSCHISFHRLRITERIEHKLLSLTYKVLTTTQPPYTFITSSLFNVLAVLAFNLSVVTHARPPS